MKHQPRLKAFAEKVRSLDFGPRDFSHPYQKKAGSVMGIAHREIISLSKTNTIKHAADKMSVNRVRRLFITDAKKALEGMVSATDIVDFLGGGDLYKIVQNRHGGILEAASNEHVRTIMKEKPVTIKSDETIQAALIKMHEEDVGSLPIVDEKAIVGIVTERDFVPLLSKYYSSGKVADFMSKNPITGTPGMEISDIAKVMIRSGFRRLPIVQEGEQAGIVSTIDIVNAFSRYPKTDLLEWPASKIMNKPISISPGKLVADAADLMAKNSVGGLTVVDGKKIVGVITEKDLLKVAIA